MNHRFVAVLAVACAISQGGVAGAQNAHPLAGETAAHWRGLAEVDLRAAHALIAENHPGAAPELGDVAFQERLEGGYRTALSRLSSVNSYASYTATLAAFALSLEDKHISFTPFAGPRIVRWPGFVAARRGGEWRIVRAQLGSPEVPLEGGRVISCDGEAVDDLAARRLGGFRAVWSIDAQRLGASPWLLIDEGNALVPVPAACIIDVGGQARSVDLNWRWAPMSRLQPIIDGAAPVGAAGMDVRPFGQGWWIGVQDLAPATTAVIDRVAAVQDAVTAAPFVVVDVRGNSGGNSQYADRLANVLLGQPASSAPPEPAASACPAAWRVSRDNLATLEAYRRDFGPDLGAAYVAQLETTERDMRQALAEGRNFTFDVTGCLERAGSGVAETRRFPVPVILLTDRACFSSCLLMVQRFRALGAIQVGAATDANPSYMEQRQVLLPSGVGLFAVQQKISFSQPPLIGPFVPAHAFEGDLSDNGAVEAWVRDHVVPAIRLTATT